MEKLSKDDVSVQQKSKNIRFYKNSNVCWIFLILCIFLSSSIFGVYILHSLNSTKEEVQSLKQEIGTLRHELKNLQHEKVSATGPRVKRQTGAGEDLPTTIVESFNLVRTREKGASGPSSTRSDRGPPGAPGQSGTPGRSGAPGQPGQRGQPAGSGQPGGPPGRPGPTSPTSPSGTTAGPGRPGEGGAPGGRPGAPEESSSGSSFIRWGQDSCTQASKLVYAGYAAAANPGRGKGGSTELECLSTSPSWHGNAVTNIQGSTKMLGVKFDLGRFSGIFEASANNAIMICAVCLTRKAPVITIPGRVNCIRGWHKEYDGYYMASSALPNEVFLSSKNYCVDKNPDYYTNHNDANGLKLTFVQAGSCYNGLYPCHQYTENNLIACTVCSKRSD